MEQDLSPEDFARDVLIQLMRNAVEDMKVRGTEPADEGLKGRIDVRWLSNAAYCYTNSGLDIERSPQNYATRCCHEGHI